MQLFDQDQIKMGAVFHEPMRVYRYLLWRTWNDNLPRILFCMLNPSTASELVDDPTIRRCIGFARSWGYGGLDVVNIYAFRATNPKAMLLVDDPVGEDNDSFILSARMACERVIVAWGTNARADRADSVYKLLREKGPVYCLGMSAGGEPKHPLYIAGQTLPMEYSRRSP